MKAKQKAQTRSRAKPKTIGRPTKLTPEVQETIVSAVRAGNYMDVSAAYAGINADTFHRWLKRGRRERERLDADGSAKPKPGEAPFLAFSEAIEKAFAQSEVRDVAIIGKAAETQWQAAAWRCERRFPERWGRRDSLRHDVTPEAVQSFADLVRTAARSGS